MDKKNYKLTTYAPTLEDYSNVTNKCEDNIATNIEQEVNLLLATGQFKNKMEEWMFDASVRSLTNPDTDHRIRINSDFADQIDAYKQGVKRLQESKQKAQETVKLLKEKNTVDQILAKRAEEEKTKTSGGVE